MYSYKIFSCSKKSIKEILFLFHTNVGHWKTTEEKKINSFSLFHTNLGQWPRIIDYLPYLAESQTRSGTEWPHFSGGLGWECAPIHHSGGDARSEQNGGWT